MNTNVPHETLTGEKLASFHFRSVGFLNGPLVCANCGFGRRSSGSAGAALAGGGGTLPGMCGGAPVCGALAGTKLGGGACTGGVGVAGGGVKPVGGWTPGGRNGGGNGIPCGGIWNGGAPGGSTPGGGIGGMPIGGKPGIGGSLRKSEREKAQWCEDTATRETYWSCMPGMGGNGGPPGNPGGGGKGCAPGGIMDGIPGIGSVGGEMAVGGAEYA